ncbi:MAG: hypothetical protein ABFQ62_00010 [Patescibacteria group bacterium]
MKKSKANSPVATLHDIKEMTHFIVTTINEIFGQQNKRLIKLEKNYTKLERGQGELKSNYVELKKGQAELKSNYVELKEGQRELKSNYAELKEGQSQQLDASLQVVDELKTMREEQAAQAKHNGRTNDALQEHDQRITILEQNFSII